MRITRDAVHRALEHKGNVATPDVPLPSKVGTHSGGIVNASWVQPGAGVKCAWRNTEGSRPKWIAAIIDSLNEDGTVNVQFTSSKAYCEEVNRRDLRQVTGTEAKGGINLMHGFDHNTTEAAAAAEMATTGNGTSTQDGSVEASNLEDSPVIVPDEPGSPNQPRVCITQGEIAAHLRWKVDVNAKYREVGAGLLRIMCITDQTARINTWIDVLSSSVVHLSSLSGDTKVILQARTLQLGKRKYGTHTYEAMLKWLRGKQLSDTKVNPDSEEQSENRKIQELRDRTVMYAARALVQGKDTDLAKRIRAELDKHEVTFSAADKSYSVIQRFSHECDWFEIFGV